MKQLFTSLGIFLCCILVLNSCKKDDDTTDSNPCSVAAPKASNNSPVQMGQKIELKAETISGATYKWRGPQGFTSTSQNPSFTLSENAQLGRYAVVAVVGSCVSDTFYTYVTSCQTQIASSNVTITTTTTGDYTKKSVAVPKNSTLNLNASNVNGAIYIWDAPVSDTVQYISIKNIDYTQAGKYVVRAKTAGCESTDTIEVIVNPPTPVISVSANPKVGNLLVMEVTAASQSATATYTWKRPGKSDTTTTDPKLINTTATREMAGTYSVYARVGTYISPVSAPVTVNVAFSGKDCGSMTSFTDPRTNNTYTVVSIGTTQCWMRENLRGKKAPVTDTTLNWNNAMNHPVELQGACPAGWHVPSDADWKTALSFKGDDTLKTRLNITATNVSYWTSTVSAEAPTTKAWMWNFTTTGSVVVITRNQELKTTGTLKLRCIKD